ncbi:MAG: epoxyqueuosine reductase [Proteobacteria bacterium]|nr:epoxyqueuosine reductase [Pseudomonadota bacterium]MBU1739986.1 epoxyqueuosine reductase [Pseudomonadota bacterium]
MDRSTDPGAWVEKLISDFIDHSPDNTLANQAGDKAFGHPLVGFARGDDPLFEAYKDHVGPFHLTPRELWSQTFPGEKVEPSDLTVICWILPHIPATKADNRRQTFFPAERWARGRIYGEEVNRKLRQHVVAALQAAGHQALAPQLSPLWRMHMSPEFGFASSWSERHAAYAAGLGTFGLCDGLITPVGKAMRVGSVVARIRIEPTPRPYDHHRQYCLFFNHGVCQRCVDRCPAGAITEAGKDKQKCLAHLKPVTSDYVQANYGFDGYGCGLCQTGVPCESRIPVPDDG